MIKLLFALHALAIIAVFISALALLYKTILTVCILVSLFIYAKREFDFEGLTIRYADSFGWEIAFSENQFNPIQVLPSTVITSHSIVLQYKTQSQQKRAIIICRDAMIKDNFRKLLVELKISGLSKDNL